MRKPSKIKIERGIPMPTGHHVQMDSYSQKVREAFSEMKVGDSFLAPHGKTVHKIAQQQKIKIKARKLNGKGYRIWRVE